MTTMLHTADAATAAPLAPISLDDLNDQAAFTTRVDRKYVLDAGAAAKFLRRLPAGTRVLEISGRRSFGYRSVYFDDARLSSFHDTATRRRRRVKVRTREYLDSGERYVEVKSRRGRVTRKERIASPGMDAEASDFVADRLAAARVGMDVRQLRPVLATTYRRATYVLPGGAARLTVDTELAWTLPDGDGLSAGRAVIVETKGTASPSDADRVLWSLGHRPVAVSKFATGLAALDPALPHHRWHRLLTSPLFAHRPSITTPLRRTAS